MKSKSSLRDHKIYRKLYDVIVSVKLPLILIWGASNCDNGHSVELLFCVDNEIVIVWPLFFSDFKIRLITQK